MIKMKYLFEFELEMVTWNKIGDMSGLHQSKRLYFFFLGIFMKGELHEWLRSKTNPITLIYIIADIIEIHSIPL